MKSTAKAFAMSAVSGLLCGGLLMCGCAAKNAIVAPRKVPVVHEKLHIAPIMGVQSLENIEDWPDDSGEINALLSNINLFHQQLTAEFRRCEKFGLYTVVDTFHAPTVTITPRLEFRRISNDSLIMPLSIEVNNRANGKTYSILIDAASICGPDQTTQSAFHRLGLCLGAYQRNFPYEKAVSAFYPDKPSALK